MPETMIPRVLCFTTPDDAERLASAILVKHEMVVAPTELLTPDFLRDRGPFQAVLIDADSTAITIRQIKKVVEKCRAGIPTLLHRRGRILNPDALVSALREFKINAGSVSEDASNGSRRHERTDPEKARHSILIVDDDPVMLKLISTILARDNYDVLTAENGVEALDVIRRNGVSIIVSDLDMPEMDGLDLCRKIRGDETFGVIYFVMVTAQSEKARLREAFDSGVDDFVPKPFDRDELLLRVRAGIRTVELERDLFRRKLEIQKYNADMAVLNARLEQLASTDELTGLLNRRQAMVKMSEFAELSSRYGIPLSCLVCDLDHFKKTNDTFGHAVGDRVLVKSAKAITKSIRATDIASRIGGEEFLVICPNTDLESARIIAERVRENVEKLVANQDNESAFTTVSIGVAQNNPSHQSPDLVIKEADDALYAAKAAGRNCVCTASGNIQHATVR